MPASRNAKGIDIVAYDDETETKFATVQVKTLTKRKPVKVGKGKNLFADFLVVVVLEPTSKCSPEQNSDKVRPICYVLAKNEVTTREYENEFWLQPGTYEKFQGDWEKITVKIAEEMT